MARHLDKKTTRVLDIEDTRGRYNTKHTKHTNPLAGKILVNFQSIGPLGVFGDFFRFLKKLGFWVFLVHPKTTLPDGLETSGQRAYR